jgi:hypothetical protein
MISDELKAKMLNLVTIPYRVLAIVCIYHRHPCDGGGCMNPKNRTCGHCTDGDCNKDCCPLLEKLNEYE